MSAFSQPSASAQNIESGRRTKCLKPELFAANGARSSHLTGTYVWILTIKFAFQSDNRFLDRLSVPACLNGSVTSWFDTGELFVVEYLQ